MIKNEAQLVLSLVNQKNEAQLVLSLVNQVEFSESIQVEQNMERTDKKMHLSFSNISIITQ